MEMGIGNGVRKGKRSPPTALWLDLAVCIINCSFPHPAQAAEPAGTWLHGGNHERRAPWVTPLLALA